MKNFMVLLTMCAAFEVFAHGGDSDSGPSVLEDEFSRLSHIHLPVSYSRENGLSYGYEIGEHEHSHSSTESDHTDTDHDHSTSDTDEAHADETGIEFNIHPTIMAGFDKIKRLVNLDENTAEGLSLAPASAEGRYLLVENKKWDLGPGLGVDSHLPNPLFAIGLNITGLKGKNYYSFKMLNNKNEKREALQLPVNKDAMKTWRVGDVLSYSTRGSVLFGLSVGIDPIAEIGPSYGHTGTYRVKASMEEENQLEIEILTVKTDSISLDGHVTLAQAGLGKSKGHANSITYNFDLSDENVFKSVDLLFKGRLDLVNQEMLKSGGRIHAKSDAMTSGLTVSGSFGLPIVYFNGINGGIYRSEGPMIENHSPTLTHKNLVTSTAEVRDRFTRGVISNHKWENRSLVSTLITGDHNIVSTVFSWSFSQNRTSGAVLKNKITNLSRLFPAPWLKKIQVPSNDLGYVKADFSVNFSGADVLELLNTKTMTEVKEAAMANLEKDFKTNGVRAFCRVRAYENCLALYKNFIQAKHEKMRAITAVINDAYKYNKLRIVSDNLNELVKTMFSSRYMTEAYTNSREDLIVEMRFEGENIKRHEFTN